MIDGVCGGVAEYLGIDSTIVRVGWVLLALAGGAGLLLYLVAMILMPSSVQARSTRARSNGTPTRAVAGVILVVVGLIWFLRNIGVLAWHSFFSLFWSAFFPLLLILIGIVLLFKRGIVPSNGEHAPAGPSDDPSTRGAQQESTSTTRRHRLYRSRLQRKIFGVCGGLGEYFNLDPTLIRIVFVASAFASFGVAILAYILFALILPEEPFAFQSESSPAQP